MRPPKIRLGFKKGAYGITETVELLSIGRSSLYALIRRGELEPVKLGKKTLFLAPDLTRFLNRLRGA
jgi:excisionase family DNA binding protein